MSPAPRSARTALSAALSFMLLGALAPASAAVLISQVYGGGGNSGAPLNADFVELRNTGNTPVTLTGMSLQYGSSSGTTWGSRVNLVGTIPAGGFFLVQLQGGANGAALPTADQVSTAINMSGTAGKIALVASTTALSGACPIPSAEVLDFVGYGSANCSEGGSPATATSNSLAAFRASQGCADTNINSADFSNAAPSPRNSASLAPACDGGSPPPPPPPPPPPADTPTPTTIPQIQGSAAKSPMEGQSVSVAGVVTRINNNGFFFQDATGDGNPATSDGLFVFTGTTSYPAVAVGNRVRVVGKVAEFNAGSASNADTLARTVTQLSTLTSVTQEATGLGITPTPVAFPLSTGDLERFEGMLVSLPGPFTISQNAFQARFGQLTLSAGGRLQTPTNLYRPNSSQALAVAADNARRRFILDDGSSLSNPGVTPYLNASALPRTGDVLMGTLTGVVDFGLASASNTGPGEYRIHPTVAPAFGVSNPRTSTPALVGGNVKVASFNVLNYFTTFTNGQTVDGLSGQGCSEGSSTRASNCRGADNLAEFVRQRAKIVEALIAINADAFGLMELQNNGNVAAQDLVDAVNARVGAGTYAVAPIPSQGLGTDAIRMAVVYKPARMTALAAISDTNPINDRPTLAQPFAMPNGERWVLMVNHLKSKGGCPSSSSVGNTDAGDGQGCWNAKRLQQAQRLRNFVTEVQTSTGIADTLLVGDFNAYAKEDPIDELTRSGFIDEVERFQPGAYSYVFDAMSGRLDHMLSNASLSSKVAGSVHWHINADEIPTADYNLESKAPLACGGATCPADPYSVSPFRSSDHDPIVAGLNVYKTLTAAPTSTSLVGTAGDDILVSGAGRRTLTGGMGGDQFVFTASFTGGATITDFQPGADLISLRAVLQALGIASADPIGQRFLSCRASGSDALISIDPDAAGPALPRAMLLIKTQPCAVLHVSNFML